MTALNPGLSPGPWRIIDGHRERAKILDRDGTIVAFVADTLPSADARLIAAAPELLAALRVAVLELAACDGDADEEEEDANMREWQALIARIDGKEPR